MAEIETHQELAHRHLKYQREHYKGPRGTGPYIDHDMPGPVDLEKYLKGALQRAQEKLLALSQESRAYKEITLILSDENEALRAEIERLKRGDS